MTNNDTPDFNQLSLSKPFIFEDQKQKLIYDRLKRLVGPGAADFYKDACRHMTITPRFEVTTHIVSHLLREVESALCDILEPLTNKEFVEKSWFYRFIILKLSLVIQYVKFKKLDDSAIDHKDKIRAILLALRIQKTDPIAQAWLQIAGTFPRQAHRKGLTMARQIDGEFFDFWSKSEIVLDNVLDRLEANYTKIFGILDNLIYKKDPTRADAKMILNNIPNNYITHQKFFNQLSNPKWLPLLRSRGLFLELPRVENNLEDGTIRHLPWPVAEYLQKMAVIKPDLITEILLTIPNTNNSNVKNGLLKTTIFLPSKNRALLKDKIKEWTIADYPVFQMSLLEPGVLLMDKFIEDGDKNSAFYIAQSFLEILPDDSPVLKNQKFVLHRNPKTRLERWYYDEFLKKNFKKLIDLDQERSFEFLCDLLYKYLEYRGEGRKKDSEYFKDLSHISRPFIEDHKQNHSRDDIENSLITAIRDVGLGIINRESNKLHKLVSKLESMNWDIFRRIAIYLLSESPDSATDVVAKYLTDSFLFDNSNFEHERARLMNKGFKLLTITQQKLILNWIEQADKIIILIEKQRKRAPISDNQVQRFKEKWQMDQLSYIKNDLLEDLKRNYVTLVEKYGEPEYPDFLDRVTTGWVGPRSEFKAQELAGMDIEKIFKLLKTWHPKDESSGFGATKDGLGRELATAIKLDPDKFRSIAESFRDLDPTYIRHYIQAFHELSQNNYEIDWIEILKLCSWVIQQPRIIPNRMGEIMNQDPDWNWTRKAIASLVSRGINNNYIPYDLRNRIWEILEPLTFDPDPTPEDEIKNEEFSDDAYTSAINCTRGEAMNAVIEYALWVYRCIENKQDEKDETKNSLNLIPEVKSILEWHLNTQNDPSSAVRSVYGRFFPWLLLVDKQWTLENLNIIIPYGKFGDRLYMAVWNTLMMYVPVYNDPFDVLKPYYHEAIANFGKVTRDSKRRYIDVDQKVAEHLMIQYSRGKIDMSDILLEDFWKIATDDLRGHALSFIGRSLKNDDEELNQDILDRMKKLWESRLSKVKMSTDKSIYKEEMSAFGWWFASGKFDSRWSCEQYLSALEIGGRAQSDYFITERLSQLAKSLPLETIKILNKLVLLDQSNWIVFGDKDEMRDTISTVLNSSEESAKILAVELINRLVSKGYTNFGILLRNAE